MVIGMVGPLKSGELILKEGVKAGVRFIAEIHIKATMWHGKIPYRNVER